LLDALLLSLCNLSGSKNYIHLINATALKLDAHGAKTFVLSGTHVEFEDE